MFAAEQLGKRLHIEVGKETLRGWMIEAGLWQPGSRAVHDIHCWRARRSGFGELEQWDTSDHDWLEGRGAVRYLVRLIDDATSRSWGRFVEADATPQNMAVLWEYLEKNGRMVDVYTDRPSMFTAPSARQSAAQSVEQDRSTQIGRGLREFGYRLDRSIFATGQRSYRMQLSDRTGPSGEATPARVSHDFGRRQSLSRRRVLAGMECALRQAGGRVSQSSPAAQRVSGSWATSPGATPTKLCEHTRRVEARPSNRNFLLGRE